jgi:endonuclease/exonuclease/phosphatase family metal-dependent hydrolase
MKLICLNLWGGRQGGSLFDYLTEQAADTDIFCFQEVFQSASKVQKYQGARIHLFEELISAMPDFIGYFAPAYEGWVDMERVDFGVTEGQAIFLRNNLQAIDNGSIYIYGGAGTEFKADFTNEPKILQYCVISSGQKKLLVANVHGMWYPGDKFDTPDRLNQSEIIKFFLDKYSGQKILCGDFNLHPESKSIAMLEQNLVNLIKTYGIKNTRNEISWQLYDDEQYFADFTFTSPDIRVSNFSVPYVLVSDHLPMILEFD